MKELKKYFKGFTLVELIIVITILAILATIAFVSFQGYVSDARDANRTATIKNIEKGLELFTIKTGNFPAPDGEIGTDKYVFTGGLDGKTKINQGIIGENVARFIQMNKIPLDPKDESKYTYSTFGNNHKYYQVAIDSENLQTSFISKTFAFSPKSAIVQGNYRFDPSLPSLIVVPSSIEGKTIFDPNVCFIIDGGGNNFSSTAANCTKKKDMELKKFDSSLVGYWDMETCTGTGGACGVGDKLKDLSGNGNDGVFTGNILPTSTGGYLGNGIEFSSGILDCGSGESLISTSNMTITSIIKVTKYNNVPYPRILNKGAPDYLLAVGNTGTSIQTFGSNFYDTSGKYVNPTTQSYSIIENNYYFVSTTFKDNSSNIFVNGIKINHILEGTINKNLSFGTIRNTGNLFIGNSGKNGSRQFNGIIDEVKIYNRALTDEEILQQAKIAGF